MAKFYTIYLVVIIFVNIYVQTESSYINTNRGIGLSAKRSFKENIFEILEQFRGIMDKPHPEYRIPQLEPLLLDYLPFDFSNNLMALKGNVNNLKIKGLSDFVANDASANLIFWDLMLNITLPYVELNGNYKIDGNIGKMIKLNSNGSLSINITKVDTLSNGKFKLVDQRVQLSKLTMQISVYKIDVRLENLTNIESVNNLINNILSKSAAMMFNAAWPQLEPTATNAIKEMVTEKLKDVTLQEIIDAITGNTRK